jgi:hypothetical protein
MNSACTVLCISFALVLFLILTYNKCAKDNSALQEHMSGYGITSGLAFNNRGSYYAGNGMGNTGGYSIPHRVII